MAAGTEAHQHPLLLRGYIPKVRNTFRPLLICVGCIPVTYRQKIEAFWQSPQAVSPLQANIALSSGWFVFWKVKFA